MATARSTPRGAGFVWPIVGLFVMLGLAAAVILTVAANAMNESARHHDEVIARSALGVMAERTASLVRDYAWWDETVLHLFLEPNPGWVDFTLVEWPHEQLDMTEVLAARPSREIVLAAREGERLPDARPDRYGDDMWALIDEAHETTADFDVTEPETAYVRIGDEVHVAAAFAIRGYEADFARRDAPTGTVLVFTRKLDDAALARMERSYGLNALALSEPGAPQPRDRASLALAAADGTVLAQLAWRPKRPGSDLLTDLALPLGLAFLVAVSLGTLIVLRARRAALSLVETEGQMRHMAMHDALTGLPNRPLLQQRLSTAAARCERHGTPYALMVFDIDHFKRVNDTLGHAAGDELLVKIADRLQKAIRATDTLARLGGDEFALLVEGDPEREPLTMLAGRLCAAAREPVPVAGQQVRVSISIGIAMAAPDTADPEAMLQRADLAMYARKKADRDGFSFYDRSMDPLLEGVGETRK